MLVAVLGIGLSLLLAVFADRVVRGAHVLQDAADLALRGGAGGGRRAVAVHVLALASASSPTRCAALGIDWNHLLNGNQAMTLIVMAAVWKQISYNFLFFLAGLQSIPKSLIEAAAIDGAAAVAALLDDPVPAALADHLLPARHQHRLRLLRHLRASSTRPPQGGPGKDTSILVYKVYYDGFKALDLGGSAAQSVVLMVIVIALTVLQFRFVEKKVNY